MDEMTDSQALHRTVLLTEAADEVSRARNGIFIDATFRPRAGTAVPFLPASPRMRASLRLIVTLKRSNRLPRSPIPAFRSCTRLFPK